jgi:hypothetical protein
VSAIIVQSFISAPPATVWAALFSHPELILDGLPLKAWPGPREEQPPFHLHVAWPATPEPTELSLTIHEVGGGVRLDVRHEGWGEGAVWEEAVQGHFAGWLHGVALLGLMVEQGRDARVRDTGLRGAERYLISGEVPAPASPVYRALTDAGVLGRWSEGVLEGATILERVEDRLVRWTLAQGGELVAILRPTPRGTHVALAEYGVRDRGASARWPAMFNRLTTWLT